MGTIMFYQRKKKNNISDRFPELTEELNIEVYAAPVMKTAREVFHSIKIKEDRELSNRDIITKDIEDVGNLIISDDLNSFKGSYEIDPPPTEEAIILKEKLDNEDILYQDVPSPEIADRPVIQPMSFYNDANSESTDFSEHINTKV